MSKTFLKSLKTFESDITGEMREYKVNNMVWLYLEAKHKLSQGKWAAGIAENQTLYGSYFVAGVMKANGIEVTHKEVLENTNIIEIENFITAFQTQALDLEDLNKEDETEGSTDEGE